jgi:hypothetical protein
MLTLQMYCGLHFQFRRAHYHLWNTLYTIVGWGKEQKPPAHDF